MIDLFIQKKQNMHVEKSNKIIAVSNQTKEDLVTYFKVNPDKISVIYQSCHNTFKKKQKNPDILKKYNLPNDFLLSVGTIEKRKNLKILLESIKNNPGINLVCIGKKTRYYKKLKNYISDKKIKNKILFPTIKKMNDLSDIYKEAKCLVYPSIYEGFGIPIIEALYSEIPAVIFNKKIFREAGGPYSHYFNNKNELEEILKKIWVKPKEKDQKNKTIKKICGKI